MASTLPSFASWPAADPILKLPHPHLTPFFVSKTSDGKSYQIRPAHDGPHTASSRPPWEPLHNDTLSFTDLRDLKNGERPQESNNTPWARCRRSPAIRLSWRGTAAPTLAQLWLVLYAATTVRPGEEYIRIELDGPGREAASQQLRAVLLAISHPTGPEGSQAAGPDELVFLRGTFWQGAGSPFGPRPVWLPQDEPLGLGRPLSSYPLAPLDKAMTAEPPTTLAWHPRRAAKPRPGSVVYSRYVPHLAETFSMVALDYRDEQHVGLFHAWQNDPRVSQGWNETGTLEEHREYLRKADEDPHQITILARFEDTCFAYFEVYWAKEDRLGAYYSAGDFDRGRHSLVGDVRFRGPHRVSAWWSSLMHYLFLDEPRTMFVVGEPKYTNSTVLAYDFINGFGLDKFVDLPHKRSGFVRCSRERFFQLSPLAENEKVIGGTGVGLLPKL